MLSRIDNPPPQTVHPLRSRIVFFMRDWSLTLYVAPFALARPSYWSLLIFLSAMVADRRLQQDIGEVLSCDSSRTEPRLAYYLERHATLIAAVIITVAALLANLGQNGLFAGLGLCVIAALAIAMMDRALLGNIPGWISLAPRYRDGTIDYPTLAGGPLLFLFVVEPTRLSVSTLIIIAAGEVNPVLFGSLGLVLIAAAYWVMAPVVAANDEIRARTAREGGTDD